jgi:type IV secretory pathway VirB3-like protein
MPHLVQHVDNSAVRKPNNTPHNDQEGFGMTTEERRNRVYKALHKPLLIFGIERKIFGGVVAIAYLIHYATQSFLAAICTFVLCAVIGYIVTKKDPIYFQVLMQSFKFKTIYDAAKHEMPKVEIR